MPSRAGAAPAAAPPVELSEEPPPLEEPFVPVEPVPEEPKDVPVLAEVSRVVPASVAPVPAPPVFGLFVLLEFCDISCFSLSVEIQHLRLRKRVRRSQMIRLSRNEGANDVPTLPSSVAARESLWHTRAAWRARGEGCRVSL
jgi:hypothetical protein